MEEMREEKSRKYAELKGSTKPGDQKEFERWFFKYSPAYNSKWKGKRVDRLRLRERTTPTKTIVLKQNNTPSYVRRQVTRKKPRKIKSSEPYAKRKFYFGKRR